MSQMLWGSGVGQGSAVGTNCLNLAHCERERQSAIEFDLDGMYFALIKMLCLRHVRTSLRTIVMTLGDLDVVLLMT